MKEKVQIHAPLPQSRNKKIFDVCTCDRGYSTLESRGLIGWFYFYKKIKFYG